MPDPDVHPTDQPRGDSPSGEPVLADHDKRYCVDAILIVSEEIEVVRDGDNSHLLLQEISRIPGRCNGLPMTGVLSIQAEFILKFLPALLSIGAARELRLEKDEERLAMLRAMLVYLPKAVALEMLDGTRGAGKPGATP